MEATQGTRIVGFNAAYADDFARLNYEWIEKYFTVEEHDREMLDAPFEYVIKPGGEVFFAVAGGTVAGTVAMLNMGDNVFELAKMAVSPAFQGRGIAGKLITACIDLAATAGARLIFLESNTKLENAIRLYQKFGFKEVPEDKNSPYSRCNIRMELAIGGRDV